MRWSLLVVGLLVAGAAAVGHAATQGAASDGAPTPAFEAASIKESEEFRPTGAVPPDRFVRRNITLHSLLVYAYELSTFQIDGGPDWVREARFDIEAKADGAPSAHQMRAMVRRLLAERFSLQAHLETQDRPRYALVMARDDRRLGPRIRRSAIDCPAIVAARGPAYVAPTGPPAQGDPPPCALRGTFGGGRMTTVLDGMPLSRLVTALQLNAERVIVDRTGLTGTYDIEFTTEMPSLPGFPASFGQSTTPADELSLFTALEEQLGMKLESERGAVEVLVIDRAEWPAPN